MSYLGLETVKPTKPMKRGDLYSFPVTTVDQIITDEDTNERLPEYLDNLTGMDLLWTNASPTSSFAAQTINLSLNNYRFIAIDYVYSTTSQEKRPLDVIINTENSGYIQMYQSKFEFLIRRKYTILSNGIAFSSGEQAASSTTTKNDYAIPVHIYGIK